MILVLLNSRGILFQHKPRITVRIRIEEIIWWYPLWNWLFSSESDVRCDERQLLMSMDHDDDEMYDPFGSSSILIIIIPHHQVITACGIMMLMMMGIMILRSFVMMIIISCVYAPSVCVLYKRLHEEHDDCWMWPLILNSLKLPTSLCLMSAGISWWWEKRRGGFFWEKNAHVEYTPLQLLSSWCPHLNISIVASSVLLFWILNLWLACFRLSFSSWWWVNMRRFFNLLFTHYTETSLFVLLVVSDSLWFPSARLFLIFFRLITHHHRHQVYMTWDELFSLRWKRMKLKHIPFSNYYEKRKLESASIMMMEIMMRIILFYTFSYSWYLMLFMSGLLIRSSLLLRCEHYFHYYHVMFSLKKGSTFG